MTSRDAAPRRSSVLPVALLLAACSPSAGDDDNVRDVFVPEDATGEAGADADADAAPGDDGVRLDVPPGDDGTAPDDGGTDDAAPSAPVCRYECAGDDVCRTIYGAGWVCRDATVSLTGRACLRLCSVDTDCRFGAASDPLMVCRSGACAMRPCVGAGVCGWVGAGADCLEVAWGTMRTCRHACGTDADCGSGVPSDVMYHCVSGLCEWYCGSDDDCFAAFGTHDYGCRTATGVPGPTCVRGCASTADCLLGGPTDSMAVCR
jgi:hypothetical protein